jgi:hypothetical protein
LGRGRSFCEKRENKKIFYFKYSSWEEAEASGEKKWNRKILITISNNYEGLEASSKKRG